MPINDSLDLSHGSVLHIKGFSTRGHPPRNKFCVILGRENPSGEVLAFLISSQPQYAKQSAYCNEIVTIPKGAVHYLPQESFIQCFVLERLDPEKLADEFDSGAIDQKGKLPTKYLYRIKASAEKAKLLTQQEIDSVIHVLALP